jgi:hypothetical protein
MKKVEDKGRLLVAERPAAPAKSKVRAYVILCFGAFCLYTGIAELVNPIAVPECEAASYAEATALYFVFGAFLDLEPLRIPQINVKMRT